MLTQTELIEKVKKGERIKPQYSMYDEEIKDSNCNHSWRVIACNFDLDVVECYSCGKQKVVSCNFDEEYN